MSPNNKRVRRNGRQGATRHGRYALWITLGLIAVICSAAFVVNPLALLLSQTSPEKSPGGAPTADQRTGTIVFEIAPHQCKHVTFDNDDNGRLSESLGSCEDDVVFDAQGKPIPMGTMHRLDAISKSFSHGKE
jgi:hypothetical protein